VKICYIAPKFYGGSIPFFEYTQGLAALGHQVHVIVPGREGETSFDRVGDVTVERITSDHSSRQQNFRFTFLQFLFSAHRALERRNNWDIINVRNLPGVSFLPRFQRNQQTAKWALEIMSPSLHASWRSTMSNYRTRLESRSFAVALVHAQEVAVDIFGSNNDRFIELPIGVDFDHFRPGKNPDLRQALGILPDEILFIYSGSIMPIRQLDKLLRGFSLAQQAAQNLHLLFVGTGLAVQQLEELATMLGVGSRVHFSGLVSYEDIPDYMHAADIGLGYVPMVPWFDKAPVLKTMESLASGLPTIATATRGNQLYIEDGVNGMLVQDTPEALAKAMRDLASNAHLRAKFSNGREFIDAYQWKRIVGDILIPTYERLVANSHMQTN
jgi:glycosyltransferase involved in cell wall biosynthesis